MAINYELINKGGISLGTNFELLGEKPLDARLVVPSLDGLAHLIAEKAAYAGMIVYVTAEAKHYQVNADGSYREFGINEDELKALIAAETTAAMEFKGATASLPENPSKGDMWKVAANFTVDDEEVKIGDSIVYNGEQWFIIPSGDDIEDTWRPVTGVSNDAALKFEAGANLDVAVATNGTITYSHEEIDAPELLAENEHTRTYITEVTTDGHGHIIGYKTATENVEDTNTTYDFECAAEHSNVYFTVKEMNGEEVVKTHTVCVDAYNKNEVNAELLKKANADDVKALIKEIYGGDAIVDSSRIDTAVTNAAEALRVAGVASGDAAQAKSDAAGALEAAQNAADAKTGAAASASAAAGSASDAAASADAASKSQSAAAGSASAASASASNAATSADNAGKSAQAAAQSAGDASVSAGDASASATAAAGYADAASGSATLAGQKASAAELAQSKAETAQSKAEGAQTKAESAQAAAEAAKNAAEASNTSATAIANQAKADAEAAVGTANGAKAIAEKAIQDVANVANNGLILTKSADNKISVDWDSNVVFVFNCGSSTTLVD